MQRAHCPLERAAQVAVLREAVWGRPRVRGLETRLVDRRHLPRTPPLATPARLVDADPVQPGEEARVALEPSDPPPRPDERLLRDLLGVMAIRHKANHDSEQVLGVPAHELLERLAFAGLRARDQLGVLVDRPATKQAGDSIGRHRESFPLTGEPERRRTVLAHATAISTR